MKKLLAVEDRFTITSRGLVVVPGPLVDEYDGADSVQVELRCPDGTVLHMQASITSGFRTPSPNERRLICLLNGASKDQVPVGAEVWTREELVK